MADDDSSELSSLSSLSAPPSEDESDIQLERRAGILKFFHKTVDQNPELEKESTPPRSKREPSPPHEYVLADNPDIAFIVMFRARFTEVLPKNLANFGPQELERDVVDTSPGERVGHFLCAVLGLLLNRKQDVKPGHYNRALEEAIQSHKSQWAREWEGQSPISGSATFASMTPVQRLALLRTLIQWALCSSDAVKTLITQQYKNRQEDDLHIALSVQPWGSDGDKRRYFLIEGNDDTAFRVYRESNPVGLQRTWWNVAGTIDELKTMAEKLETVDGGPKARALAKRIKNSIPRFEATEEKRRRREYRQMRKEQFKRPDNGLSLYEGRTRGKRMKYTYSDDEGDFFSDSTNRRSSRNTRNHTPAEPAGPVVTASGRQIRAPNRLTSDAAGGALDEHNDVDQDVDMEDNAAGTSGRPRRSAAVHHSMNGWATKKRKIPAYDSEEDDDSEPDFGDDEEEEHVPDEEDDDEEEFEDPEMDDDDLSNSNQENHLFIFPIKAAIDDSGKAVLVPNAVSSSPADKHKHPRAAHSHRNVPVSDSSGPASGSESTEDPPPEAEEKAAEEVIAVAIKRPTPETVVPTITTSASKVVQSPLTPPEVPSMASLAFRESPEKPRSVPQPINVGGTE